LCRQLESAGCSYLTIHARTKYERHEPVHLDQLKLAVESTSGRMPVVANGDLFTLRDCMNVCEQTGARGVMCARGLLENPALYDGHEMTPLECVRDWISIAFDNGTTFAYFHQVLSQMLQGVLSKSERRYFNTLISTSSTIDYLNEILFDQQIKCL
jgi:tRNA-dihydrouridine synthase 4